MVSIIFQSIQLSLNDVMLWSEWCMRGKRAELKIIDDSFDNWCIEHEEEINEILQSFIKIPNKTREIKNQFIYMSSKGEMK
jgi:hypothetical protein